MSVDELHHDPTEYWKSEPYLVNFMERYKLKEAIVQAAGEAVAGRRAAAMTAFLLTWASPSLAELGDPRPSATDERRRVSEVLADVAAKVEHAIEPLVRSAPTAGTVDQRWYWAAPLLLDRQLHRSATDLLLARRSTEYWENDERVRGLRAHMDEARSMVRHGSGALGRPPEDLVEVLAELAVGGPAQCAARSISSVTGLPVSHDFTLANAAWVGAGFRSFFNAPQVTAVVVGPNSQDPDSDEGMGRYWREVLRHSIDGNLQAVLDENAHVLRDWLGHLDLRDESQRQAAANDIALKVREALEFRTSSLRVDTPGRQGDSSDIAFDEHRMRTRFAVAFGTQTLDEGGEARVESGLYAFDGAGSVS